MKNDLEKGERRHERDDGTWFGLDFAFDLFPQLVAMTIISVLEAGITFAKDNPEKFAAYASYLEGYLYHFLH